MEHLYPLKFKPIYHEKVWGGDKLKNILHKKDAFAARCGEAWEISGVSGNISVVLNGVLAGKSLKEIITTYRSDVVGEKNYQQYQEDFPLLIKFIDAQEHLSIQVHPYDVLAQARHQCLGKTEMWYVLDADKDAFLIYGFKDVINKEAYVKAIEENNLMSLMHKVYAKKGDIFFIPAGTVHAIGGGVMLAEIQQSSDITYRLYDWDRVGLDGKPREMHTQLAIEAIDFSIASGKAVSYQDKLNTSQLVVQCPDFQTSFLHLDQKFILPVSRFNSFSIVMCLEGDAILSTASNIDVAINAGESALLPASLNEVQISPSNDMCRLLEVHT